MTYFVYSVPIVCTNFMRGLRRAALWRLPVLLYSPLCDKSYLNGTQMIPLQGLPVEVFFITKHV